MRLALGCADDTVKLWEIDGRAGPVLKGHDDGVFSVAWSPDGQWLASGSWDSTMLLWDADSGEPEWVAVLLKDGQSVTLSSAGQILHGDAEIIEKELVYLVETPTGTMELLKPSEFQERVARAAKTTAAVTSLRTSPGALARHGSVPQNPWFGYFVYRDAEASVDATSGYSNIVVDGTWPQSGARLIFAARESGLRVVLFVRAKELAAVVNDVVSLAKSNRDVVIAFLIMNVGTAQGVPEFRRKVKDALPGIQVWGSSFGGEVRLPDWTRSFDALTLYFGAVRTPGEARDRIESFLRANASLVKTKPIVLCWSSRTGKDQVRDCQPGTNVAAGCGA